MQETLSRPEIRYGLIIGIAVSLYILAEYLLGFHTKYLNIGRYTGYISTLIPIIGLYYAVKTKRLQSSTQTITFKTAFLTGLLTSILASVIISAFFYIYNTRINSSWMDKAIAEEKKAMQKQGLKDKEIDENIKQLKAVYSPQAQLTGVFIGTTINGAILSLIIAAIAARKKPSQDEIPLQPQIK